MSIFYGNFGIIGSVLYGIFVGVYVVVATKALMSRQLTIKVIGAYMIAIVLRCFWYGFITLIKPVIFLLVIHIILHKPRARSFVLA